MNLSFSKAGQSSFMDSRVLCWFSCGAASAVASSIAVDEHKSEVVEILYCDTLKYEHQDNVRFIKDVEQWIQKPVKILKSDDYTDIFDVFDKTGWLVGPAGARCTTELKKNVRKAYQWPEDTHVFGLTANESDRIKEFEQDNFEIKLDWNLQRLGITKKDCFRIVKDAGIKLPAMYGMGYLNNNCIGCVKGGMGYWNKIRRDFPQQFEKMAAQERKIGVAINKRYEGKVRVPVYLDELDPLAGNYKEELDIECGPQCRPSKP